MNEKLLLNAIQSPNIPNLIIYGKTISGEKKIIELLNKNFNGKKLIHTTEKDINYEFNNIYYLFDIGSIESKNLTLFLQIIHKITSTKNYYGKAKNKIIILKNFNMIKYTIQNALRVIIEKNRYSTLFIMITNKYNSIIDPILSRCLCIRFPEISSKDKRKLINKQLRDEKINISFLDSIYEIDNKEEILISLNCKESYDKGYINKYKKVCIKLVSIFNSEYSKKNHESLRDIIYNIEKYNLNISRLYYEFLSFIVIDPQIRDKYKYEIIKLFSESEYNYNHSYRSSIIIESLFFHLYKYYLYKN